MAEFRTTSLADQVFEKLENDIIFGVYPRGEILTELKLVEQLGVSRTPIREALRRLEQERLIADARSRGAEAVLYGHTHSARCTRDEDGLWVINPGSCGSYSGSVAVMEIEDKKISACRILSQTDILDYTD